MRFIESFADVERDYYRIRPHERVSVGRLYRFLDRLQSHDSFSAVFMRLNVHYELGQTPRLAEGENAGHLRQAHALVKEASQRAARTSDQSRMAVIDVHAPLLKTRLKECDRLAMGQLAAARLCQDSRRLAVSEDESERGHLRGLMSEILTSYLLNATNIPGVRAQPSIARQEASRVNVDGYKYNWDLTVFSDGAMVDEGEYRLQVKSRGGRANGWHSDIVRVNARSVFDIPADNAERYEDYAQQIQAVQTGQELTHDILLAQSRLLVQMAVVGPVCRAA